MKARAQIDLISGEHLRSPLSAEVLAGALRHPAGQIVEIDTLDGHGRVQTSRLPVSAIVAIHTLRR